jgi:pimeloyl-ACP methyl ester carboxylesterase
MSYADVNGIKLYYETHGAGHPLIVLHGGLGSTGMFGPNLAALAKGRQVIAVDLQGHGRTADIDRPLGPELMADDIAALIKHLKLERPDIMGFSLGGGVALHTAIRHPEMVGKLVMISTPIRRNAFYADILVQQGQVTAAAAEAMKQTPMYQEYASLAPRPEDWGRLLGKIGEAMKKDFDFSKEVAKIKAKTMIVAGDADIFPPAHAVEVFGLLGGGQRDAGWDGSGRPSSRLAILPGLTHYTIAVAPALSAAIIPFLDEA